jgi:hypothetical protein
MQRSWREPGGLLEGCLIGLGVYGGVWAGVDVV